MKYIFELSAQKYNFNSVEICDPEIDNLENKISKSNIYINATTASLIKDTSKGTTGISH